MPQLHDEPCLLLLVITHCKTVNPIKLTCRQETTGPLLTKFGGKSLVSTVYQLAKFEHCKMHRLSIFHFVTPTYSTDKHLHDHISWTRDWCGRLKFKKKLQKIRYLGCLNQKLKKLKFWKNPIYIEKKSLITWLTWSAKIKNYKKSDI